MVIMDDLEWPMLSYYVIYYEVKKSLAVNKEGNFNIKGYKYIYLFTVVWIIIPS